ncbi:MAG TPA: non-homologous end-joining DNA ligase [Cyclobacteriaceae bacterium]|nr:non-homologous end-joining DNA ligase [Cyclobacteriaceae bacterium]HRJ81770.1 non-homologous end-joining DNA ligase [Cyclobacteriaceae bacterium]
MAKKSQWTQVGKRKLELSNLDKVLFPEDGIVKAEVIAYYLKIAPTILNHIKGRALTLIRFPDGIHGEMFYQKNRPEWAPKWLEFERLGKEEKDYIIATEPASLVWLANLASLELHQLHSRRPNFEFPDYMVFDLDPPEGYSFEKIVSLAFDLRAHVESFGYTAFVKTTGGKGVHICCPLEPKFDFHTVFESAQLIAQPFVDAHAKETTLHIKKDARKGRVLIDIYRIRSGQSIVSPYSLRGRVGAPVSMPLKWEELEVLKSPLEHNIHNAIDKVLNDGDAWEGMDAFAVELHNHRKRVVAKELPVSKKRKTPAQLESYEKKRDFKKTPEPDARIVEGGGNNFVIHRHHASHLHYDLRLEQDGVLKSWAVPKGMPPHPGVKRLAVQTEDHPMKYLTFDGKIPKGQYGGGDMWIYALGKYTITKEKKDGFYFRLSSKELTGEYRIYQIKQKEFLLERVDIPQIDFLKDEIAPMLSDSASSLPQHADDYIYEVKWDGIRALIALEDGQLRIRSRNQNDVTKQFPELLIADKAFRATNGLFDAEIVSLDKQGKPEFKKVINRLMASGETNISKLSKSNPVYCYIFDCLYLDGRSLINEPLLQRKIWLKDAIKKDTPYRVSEWMEDGEGLLEAARAHALEGIMAKRKDGRYFPGRRSDSWLKIKIRNTAECVVIGYNNGKGNRKDAFGGLHLAQWQGEELVYRGKVGTGFDDATIKEIFTRIKKLKEIKKPVEGKVLDEKVSTWVEPKLMLEVTYASLTPDKNFREPVFVRLREDLMV